MQRRITINFDQFIQEWGKTFDDNVCIFLMFENSYIDNNISRRRCWVSVSCIPARSETRGGFQQGWCLVYCLPTSPTTCFPLLFCYYFVAHPTHASHQERVKTATPASTSSFSCIFIRFFILNMPHKFSAKIFLITRTYVLHISSSSEWKICEFSKFSSRARVNFSILIFHLINI